MLSYPRGPRHFLQKMAFNTGSFSSPLDTTLLIRIRNTEFPPRRQIWSISSLFAVAQTQRFMDHINCNLFHKSYLNFTTLSHYTFACDELNNHITNKSVGPSSRTNTKRYPRSKFNSTIYLKFKIVGEVWSDTIQKLFCKTTGNNVKTGVYVFIHAGDRETRKTKYDQSQAGIISREF